MLLDAIEFSIIGSCRHSISAAAFDWTFARPSVRQRQNDGTVRYFICHFDWMWACLWLPLGCVSWSVSTYISIDFLLTKRNRTSDTSTLLSFPGPIGNGRISRRPVIALRYVHVTSRHVVGVFRKKDVYSYNYVTDTNRCSCCPCCFVLLTTHHPSAT